MISSIVFITANRPEHLKRAIKSYQNNFKLYNRTPEFIVIDNSLEALRDLRSHRYAHFEDRHNYIAHLAKEGIDPELAKFALIGCQTPGVTTAGAARNCAILDTIGEDVFCVDDDTVCRMVAHPLAHNTVTSCKGNPRDFWFFKDRNELLQNVDWEDEDLLALHEKLLSKREVPVTVSGIVGDIGGNCPDWLLLSKGRTRKNLLKDPQTAFSSREVLGVAPAYYISTSPVCKTTAFGFRSGHCIPPFLPMGRNQDGLFGVSLRLSGAKIGHVPFAIFHAPEDGRRYNSFQKLTLVDIVLSLIKECSSLEQAQDRLTEVSSRSIKEFMLRVTNALGDREFEKLQELRSVIPENEILAIWQKVKDKLEDQILTRLNRVTSEITSPYWETLQHTIFMFGRLLSTWPDMQDAALYLKTQGIRLSS